MKTASPSTWVTSPRPQASAALRLFCFHYAGGSASSFRPWLTKVSPEIELHFIELPGHGMRLLETPFKNLNSLLPNLQKALLPKLKQPFAFLGHSMGALVSFELARSLRQDYGVEPVELWVSGQSAPQLLELDPPIHNLPDSQFLDEIRRYNGTPEAVLENAELMSLLLPTLRADFTLIETYRYTALPPFQFPITALGGTQDWKAPIDRLSAWKEQTTNTFTIKMFPGDHFFIHTAQAQVLTCLNQAWTSNGFAYS